MVFLVIKKKKKSMFLVADNPVYENKSKLEQHKLNKKKSPF